MEDADAEQPDAGVFPWIVDRDQQPLGWLQRWTRDERTDEPSGLSVVLLPDAQEALGAPEDDIYLDAGLILAVRKDEVVLDRTSAELRTLIERQGPVLLETGNPPA